VIKKSANEDVDMHFFNEVCLLKEMEAQIGPLKKTSWNKNWISKLQ